MAADGCGAPHSRAVWVDGLGLLDAWWLPVLAAESTMTALLLFAVLAAFAAGWLLNEGTRP